ncbi:MAG: helix-turn-helix transcriptional regulator [Deltaproteobacteria bacterium]|nr:helix-turn-helix transcriptional regulator [Deltaproteobacteria bacterium]
MLNNTFFKDNRLPFAQGRYSQGTRREFKPHMHQVFSIGAVDKGEVCYHLDTQSSRLCPGALALINPETLHSCNTTNNRTRSFYMLYLDVDWCLEVQKSLWQIDSFIRVEEIRLDDAGLFIRYCETMKCLFSPETHLLEKEQMLVDLASSIFQAACTTRHHEAETIGDVEQLKTILTQNLCENLTLKSLARQLNANPYTLLRRFKAATGITPHAYRTNCRIEQAKKYLQQGMDIATTALECGFFDQSHLHRHFRAMTTVTPQEYRINFVQ